MNTSSYVRSNRGRLMAAVSYRPTIAIDLDGGGTGLRCASPIASLAARRCASLPRRARASVGSARRAFVAELAALHKRHSVPADPDRLADVSRSATSPTSSRSTCRVVDLSVTGVDVRLLSYEIGHGDGARRSCGTPS